MPSFRRGSHSVVRRSHMRSDFTKGEKDATNTGLLVAFIAAILYCVYSMTTGLNAYALIGWFLIAFVAWYCYRVRVGASVPSFVIRTYRFFSPAIKEEALSNQDIRRRGVNWYVTPRRNADSVIEEIDADLLDRDDADRRGRSDDGFIRPPD